MTTNKSRRITARGNLGRFRPKVDGLEVRLAMAQVGPALDLPTLGAEIQASQASSRSGFAASVGSDPSIGSAGSVVVGSPSSATPAGVVAASGPSSDSPVGADPSARAATVVQSVRLDRADPESSAATGLTLKLSGPIAVGSLTVAPGSAVELLDASGHAWTMTPTGYDASNGELSFAFDQDLPSGPYSIVEGPGGLVDLSGRAVIAKGQSSGVLGSFVEAARVGNPDDFGTITPRSADKGLSSSLGIRADGTASKQLVVLVPGLYTISGINDPGVLSIVAEQGAGSSRSTWIHPSGSAVLEGFLKAGVYRINLTGLDPAAGALSVTIQGNAELNASLLGEGVGQAPSQPTMLLSSSADPSALPSSTAGTAPGTDARPSALTPATTPTSQASFLGAGPGTSAVTVGLATPGGAFTVVGQPMGRPSVQANQISVVGSSGTQGSIALASNGPALPAGLIQLNTRSQTRRGTGQKPGPAQVDAPVSLTEESNPASPRTKAPGAELASPIERPEGLEPDLALAADVVDGSEPLGPGPSVAVEDADDAGRSADVEEDGAGVEMASFASPMGLIAAAVVAIRYRRLREAKARFSVVPSSLKQPYRGPHRSVRSARVGHPTY